jgi:hypothetical protein
MHVTMKKKNTTQKLVNTLSDAKNKSYQLTEVAKCLKLCEVILIKYNLCRMMINGIQNIINATSISV